MNTITRLNLERKQNAKDWIESCEWWIEQTVYDINHGFLDQAKLDFERAKKRLLWAKDNVSKIQKNGDVKQ